MATKPICQLVFFNKKETHLTFLADCVHLSWLQDRPAWHVQRRRAGLRTRGRGHRDHDGLQLHPSAHLIRTQGRNLHPRDFIFWLHDDHPFIAGSLRKSDGRSSAVKVIACEVIGRKKTLFPGFLVLKMVFSAAVLFHQTPFLLSIMAPSWGLVRAIQIGEVNIAIKNSWMNKTVDVLLSSVDV